MRIILNSDLIYSAARFGLTDPFKQLVRDAHSVGSTMVVLRTVALEFERRQLQLAADTRDKINQAADFLKLHGIDCDTFDREALPKTNSLEELLRAEGIGIELVDPTFLDYQNAEHRACLHLPPCPAVAADDSDEMRDLVIWEVAVRMARTSGNVILYSNDRVHKSPLGAEEAARVNLRRAFTPDQLFEHLNKETPAGKAVREMLELAWPALRATELGLPETPQMRRVRNLVLNFDLSGQANGSFDVQLQLPSTGLLEAHGQVTTVEPGRARLALTAITSKKAPISDVIVEFDRPSGAMEVVDELSHLRQLIGGHHEP